MSKDLNDEPYLIEEKKRVRDVDHLSSIVVHEVVSLIGSLYFHT